ncbi:hypothetical protein SASPL_118914 [Salvia splendens]|uniref:Luc7-like protein 3 n=1 Tax=Salvia splendens TaxID=180675 RepID=A0A8X8XXM1_SALSN|nr:hypothetical protein SASPL_118914 [Salvia splendens]
MDAQRALLDELMGSARNLTEEERKGHREIKWDDKEVCGCYMVRFCPHDLFVNTRSDLGACQKIHDPKLKESFEMSPRHDPFVPKFEADLAQYCERLASFHHYYEVSDLDRRVRRGRERLAQDVEVQPPPPISAEKAEQLSVLEEKIKNLLEQVESLGEEGKVDEAEALMRKVELLHIEKTALTQQPQDKLLMAAQEKKMALCEICGSFLVANDAAERTQSHVTGKQHVGYGMVRDFLVEYKVIYCKSYFSSGEKPRRRQKKKKDWLGREKLKNEGSCRIKNMRVNAEEVAHLIGTGLVTGIMTGRGTDIVNVIDIMEGMVEEAERWEEGQIGRTLAQVMEEKGVGIDIENMKGADLVLLPNMVAGGHPGVQAVHIRELCRNISGL